MDVDITPYIDTYRQRRDFMVEELKNHYEIVKPGGAFYLFPKLPWGNGQQFVERAIENNLMIIPGNIFSDRDTHFRISYAVSDEMLERGIDVLKRIAAC